MDLLDTRIVLALISIFLHYCQSHPFRTAEADVLAFLRDLCDNSRTTEATSTRKALQEIFFTAHL